MGRVYDDWERLVEAVCRREQLRQLSLEDSRTPSTRSFDSDFSFSSSSESFRIPPSPLNPDILKTKLLKERKRSGTAKRRWKGLSFFGGLSFSSKKDYGREERELLWAEDRRTIHGLESMKTGGDLGKLSYEETSRMAAEEAKKRAEIARLQELHTLKGHIESVLKMKGLNIDSLQHYYTI